MKNLLQHRVRQIRRAGAATTARLAWERVVRRAGDVRLGCLAHFQPTGLRTWPRESPPHRVVPMLSLPQDGAEAAWCAHVFDLLGSGPRELNLKLTDPRSALPRPWHARFGVLSSMLPAGYRLIDWQLDPTSGYCWAAQQWSRTIAYGDQPGVEIKWPWELARLQHLPALAGRIKMAIPETQRRIESEIRSEIIDFVMQNPPGFGVNWTCAMDVGIRAANLALAVDLARAAGTEYDKRFLSLVSATLRDHGRFLVRNLEWGAALCSNHYLADVVGLLFGAAYLPEDRETAGWLAFAGREVGLQLRQQFHPDGTNFEASTCYHRLSAEMMVYGSALMLDLARRRPEAAEKWWAGSAPRFHPPPVAPALPATDNPAGVRVPFDEPDTRRLAGMGLFTQSLLRRNGTIPLIGDDDSGRFVRLSYGSEPYADLLSHAHLPAAVAALFKDSPTATDTPESVWLREWVGDAALARPADLPRTDGPFLAFPDFGLYVWNRGRFRLTLRCGPVGQNGNGGHAHSDQLSITLDVDGQAVVIDPGTGVYTPDPETRNRFRSAAAHSTIVVPGREPNDWLLGRWGLFAMKDKSRARMIWASPDGAEAEHEGFNVSVRRNLRVSELAIEVTDDLPASLPGAFTQVVLAGAIKSRFDERNYELTVPGVKCGIRIRTGEGSSCSASSTISPRYGVLECATILRWRSRWLRCELI